MKRTLILILLALIFSTVLFAQEDLSPVWRYPMGGKMIGNPVISIPGGQTRVYALSEDRHLYAFSSEGKFLWKSYLTNLPSGVMSVGKDESIYLGLSPGSLGAVNLRGGTIWKTPLRSGPIQGIATSDRGLIFASTEEGELVCLDHRGRIRWRRDLTAGAVASPVYASQWGVICASNDQRIVAYSPGGELLWMSLLAAPAVNIIPLPQGIAVATEAATLVLFDYQGRLLWSRSLSGASDLSLLASSSDLIFGGEGVGLQSANFQGEIIPLVSSRGGPFALGSEDQILTISSNQGLITMDGPFENASWMLASSFLGSAIDDKGRFYVGSKDWAVLAYDIPVTIASGWSRHGGDVHRSYLSEYSPPGVADLTPMDNLYLSELANRPQQEDKLTVLTEILTGLEEERYTGTEPSLLRLLERLAGEGIDNPAYRGKNVANDFPAVRRKAAEIIGQWGDLLSRETLIRIFAYEWEPSAALVQAQALGNLGSDPFGEVTRLLASRVAGLSGEAERYLWGASSLYILESLMIYNGDYPDPAGASMVFSIYRGAFGREARKKALALMRR